MIDKREWHVGFKAPCGCYFSTEVDECPEHGKFNPHLRDYHERPAVEVDGAVELFKIRALSVLVFLLICVLFAL
jgi:hypothetical protein